MNKRKKQKNKGQRSTHFEFCVFFFFIEHCDRRLSFGVFLFLRVKKALTV